MTFFQKTLNTNERQFTEFFLKKHKDSVLCLVSSLFFLSVWIGFGSTEKTIPSVDDMVFMLAVLDFIRA